MGSPGVPLASTVLVLASLSVTAASAIGAELNLGFETLDAAARPLGWSFAAATPRSASDATAVEGERSLRLTRATAAGITRVTQRVPAALLRADGDSRAQRCGSRLTGLARTSAPGVSAALWLRVDGPRGPLFLDSAGYGREPIDASPRSRARTRREATRNGGVTRSSCRCRATSTRSRSA